MTKLINFLLAGTLIQFLVVSIALLFVNCNNQQGHAGNSQHKGNLKRNETLYVGGLQWGPPASFNPLHGSPAWPLTGNVNLIYESLFGYNQLTGKLEGILATDFVFSKNVLEVQLHPAAKWHNGSPVTNKDVAYTFNFHKKYYTNYSSHWNFLQEVKSDTPGKIIFTLLRDNLNPLMIRDIISTTPILPQSVISEWEAQFAGHSDTEILEKIREIKNDDSPMGSGPYTLSHYSNQKIVLERIEDYWGNVMHDNKPPAPRYIVHSGYKSNDKFNLALRQGLLDISQTFYPQIWKSFKEGVNTWYTAPPYYIPTIIPSLVVNHTKSPFDNKAFRQALARAINYEQIKNIAMYGYTPDIKPGFIIPFGKEGRYFSKADAQKYGPLYSPEVSKKILSRAGYSWGNDGMLIDPQGVKVPSLTATCPSGWSDWESTLKIVVSSLRAVGIDVREKFVEYPIWDKELKNGLFDITMRTPQPDAAPSLPWSRFDKVMSSKNFRPPGEVMYQNEGRYQNPLADSLLKVIPMLESEDQKKKAYLALNELFMNELPVIPLMYRPWHLYQFSTRHWNNFPNEANPYAPPQMAMIGAGVKALWQLQSVSNL